MKARILAMSLAVVTLALTGCNKDENDATIDNWNGEIRLSSGVTVQTRAVGTVPDTQIAGGQKVGVFITNTSDAPISTNLEYNADGNGGLALASGGIQPYYPATSESKVKIYAYHPYTSEASSNPFYDFTVKTDQNANSSKDYYDSDLLYSESKEYSRSKDAQSLSFKHKLSKVVCTLKIGDGVSSVTGATVSIVDAETKGTFMPSNGAFATTNGNTAAITMNSTITEGSYIAILPPQTFVKAAKFLEVTLNGGTYYYKIPNGIGDDDLTLAAGSVYKYEITVKGTGLSVKSTIDEWAGVNNAAKEGTAEMN